MKRRRKVRDDNETISRPLRFRRNKPARNYQVWCFAERYWNMYESISARCRQDNERRSCFSLSYVYIRVWSFELLFKANHSWGRAGLSFLLHARKPGTRRRYRILLYSLIAHHLSRVQPLSCFVNTRCCPPVTIRDKPNLERRVGIVNDFAQHTWLILYYNFRSNLNDSNYTQIFENKRQNVLYRNNNFFSQMSTLLNYTNVTD